MHHTVLKFSIYLEFPSPGKLFLGTRKKPFQLAQRRGDVAGFIVKIGDFIGMEYQPGFSGSEVRVRRWPGTKG